MLEVAADVVPLEAEDTAAEEVVGEGELALDRLLHHLGNGALEVRVEELRLLGADDAHEIGRAHV